VDSVAALKDISPATLADGDSQHVLGYYAANDGGGGLFRWNASSTAADDGGITFIPSSSPDSGRWQRIFTPNAVQIRWFGAKGTGWSGTNADRAADHAAFQAALNWANNRPDISFAYGGATIYLGVGEYVTSGGFTQRPGVHIVGGGSEVCLIETQVATPIFTALETDPASHADRSWRGFSLIGGPGNTNTAVGIIHGNAIGGYFEDIYFKNFPNGTAVELRNSTAATEETTFFHCYWFDCGKGVFFNQANPAITNSFSSTRLYSCRMIQDRSGQVGLAVGPTTSGSSCYLYSCTFDLKLMNNHAGPIGMNVQSGSQVVNSFFNLLVEGWTSPDPTSGTMLQMGAGTVLHGHGRITGYAGPGSLTQFSLNASATFALDDKSVSGDRGDASVTLTTYDARIQRFNTPLTAVRTVTLPSNVEQNPAWFRVVRQAGATGAFSLNISDGSTTLKSLSVASQWAEFSWTGSAWIETANGSL
jgi:hypothetical protein